MKDGRRFWKEQKEEKGMKQQILEHYKETGTYTYAGAYREYFRSLPDDLPVPCRVCALF